jgi:hypothetical protein
VRTNAIQASCINVVIGATVGPSPANRPNVDVAVEPNTTRTSRQCGTPRLASDSQVNRYDHVRGECAACASSRRTAPVRHILSPRSAVTDSGIGGSGSSSPSALSARANRPTTGRPDASVPGNASAHRARSSSSDSDGSLDRLKFITSSVRAEPSRWAASHVTVVCTATYASVPCSVNIVSPLN